MVVYAFTALSKIGCLILIINLFFVSSMNCGHWFMNLSWYAIDVLRLATSSRYPRFSLPSITSNLLFSNSGLIVSGVVHSVWYPHVAIRQGLCYLNITQFAITHATKRLPAYKVTISCGYSRTPICKKLLLLEYVHPQTVINGDRILHALLLLYPLQSDV